MTVLHLIRHGRASAMEADYDKLHTVGEAQARLLGEHYARMAQRFDAVYVGPLKRQLETLRLMREAAESHGVRWPEAVVHEGLAEGPFEVLYKIHMRPQIKVDAQLQQSIAEMRSAADDAARTLALEAMAERMVELWKTEQIVADDLEPAAVFAARVLKARDAIAEQAGSGRHVAVITSHGVIGELLDGAPGLAPQGAKHRFYNTSVTVMELMPTGPRLQRHNSTEHIVDPELLTLL